MSPTRSTARWRRSNGPEHQQRRARRQPDARPRAAAHAVRHRRDDPADRRQRPRQARRGLAGRRVLLRRHGLGPHRRELRPVPREGTPGRRPGQADLARVGCAGRDEAPVRRGRRRQRPVPRRPRRRGRWRPAVRAGRGLAELVRRLPCGRGRRRHSVLGDTHGSAENSADAQASRLLPRPRAAEELPLLQGQDRRGRLQEPEPAPALHLGEGEDPQPPHHRRLPPPPAAGRRRGQAGARDGAPALRGAALMEVILLSDVDKVGLRGEVVNVARGYARNFLLPRKLAEPATAGRVAELKRLDEQRARHEARSVEQAEEIADVLRKTVLSFDVKAGPTGALFGSVTTTDIADELWRTRKIRVDRRKIETDSIRRIGRYAIPIQIFEDVTVEVKTLVVPEGGELPPEEELAAMEAAEAEEQAAREAEAEAHRAEAEEILEAELAAEGEAAAAESGGAEPEAEEAAEPAADAEPEAEQQ